MRKLLVIIGLVLWIGGSGLAQVTVKAQLETGTMTVGDHNILSLEAIYPDAVQIKKIDLSPLDSIIAQKGTENPDPQIGDLEILNLGKWDTLRQGGQVILRNQITFTCWGAGAYPIPELDFLFANGQELLRGQSNPLMVMVSPPAKISENPDSLQLAPIKDIIEEKLNFQDILPFLIGILGLLLFLFIAWLLYRRLNRKEATSYVTIKRPAHEVAYEKLALLKKANLWQNGQVKEYQSELTYIVREYLENRFNILALESTSREIIQALQKQSISSTLTDKLKSMLELADMVKFAKAQPPAESHQQLMAYAEEIIKQTIPVVAPEDSPSTEDKNPTTDV